MARCKAFDEDETLQRATLLFQAKGFEATSIQDLVEHLGINRQSLYDTYGDKQALWLASLERYRRAGWQAFAELLESRMPLRKALGTLFGVALDRLFSPDGAACLMSLAALERAGDDPETRACVQDNLKRFFALFEARLRRAQADGELGPGHDPAALARYFQNAFCGLQVTVRSGASRDDLEDIVRVTLSVL
ncbi:MAG: TetR/AcrR family transcriptional regulator [Holophaga sp.]|nr:TetR/AcrR family transcriptional regulator [Holophaga sp.]